MTIRQPNWNRNWSPTSLESWKGVLVCLLVVEQRATLKTYHHLEILTHKVELQIYQAHPSQVAQLAILIIKMITRYLTDITARFNPFSHSAKSARVFLSMINSDARNDIQIKTTVLSRTSKANPSLDIKFSMYILWRLQILANTE